MNKTPETNNARLSIEERRRFAKGDGVLYEMVPADFARRLERELDDAMEALRPFANAWAHASLRYEKVNSDWHQRMPGHWPWNPRLTIEDARRAASLLARLDGNRT